MAAHPETSISRMEGQEDDPGGALREIRLVKNDGAPSPFSAGDLSLWTSPRNGGYSRYKGPMSVRDSLEWRPLYPYQDAPYPIYPEVRQDWLGHLRTCIDKGADAVNIRTASHNKVYEPRCFGFDKPVVDQMLHPGNTAEARRINGYAYTLFLREAAELAHGAGKEIGVHVHGLMLRHDDRAANNSMVPDNFEWQWETWLKEIADFVEYRGAFFFRPDNHHDVADRVGFVARASRCRGL